MNNTGQVDRSIHRKLPPESDWPELVLPEHLYSRRPLNCVESLLDQHLRQGHGDRIALLSNEVQWSYRELNERVCRIANLLVNDFGVESGNRILLRGKNSPELAALWLAIQKCGAIAVTTMSLLRSGELKSIIELSNPVLSISEAELVGELQSAVNQGATPTRLLTWSGASREMEELITNQPTHFATTATFSDDIALIGFTSGTTGRPKGTVHFHRDVIAVCETVADRFLQAEPGDRFIGTSPLAFTFGLGGLVLFPLYSGASTVLNPQYTPEELLEGIERFNATICFTVPSFYQRMCRTGKSAQTRSLRLAVSSGEALPLKVRQEWHSVTGMELAELLGSTEMLHGFVGSRDADVRPGSIGRALPGYQTTILDQQGEELPAGEIGRFAVKGPTGCRYLDDPRQQNYVQQGWNITGDACSMDADGYVQYQARMDDLIISSGYNISGIEVENALLEHVGVAECAVIGMEDEDRGQVVTAFVVPVTEPETTSEFISELQAFVKQRIAPYKYPRRIHLLDALPRNESGKIQRFRLRNH